MGLFLSSQYLTDMTDAIKIAQSDIVILRSHGDAAWLHLQKSLERLEGVKLNLYYKSCSRCKALVKEVFGDIPARRSNLSDVLPPDKQVLLRGIVRSLIEMEMSRSSQADVSDKDISQVLEIFNEDRYVRVDEEREKATKVLKEDNKTLFEKVQKAELERDEAFVSKCAIEKERNEMQKTIKHLQDEMDKIRAEKEELETVVKKRTQEGSKLRAENTVLKDEIVVKENRLEAQNKVCARLKEIQSRTATENEKNWLLKSHVTEQTNTDDKEGVLTEIGKLQEKNKEMSAIIGKLQCDLGTKENELQALQEKANTDIQVLSEAKILLEEKNAKHMKEIANSAKEVTLLQKQLKESETRVKESETSLAKLKTERQKIEESMEKQITELQDSKARNIEEIFYFTEENSRLKESNKSMESQIETLNKELTSVSQNKNMIEMELETIEKEKEEMGDVLNKKLKQLQEENTTFVHEISKATEENYTLRQTISTSENQIKALTEKITSISQTQKELEVASRAQEMKTLEMQDSLNRQLKHLQEENYNYRKENSDSAEEIERLKRTLTSESQSMNELEKTVRTLESEKLEVTDRLTNQLNHLQELKDNVTSGVAILQQDNNKLKDDLKKKTDELESALNELRDIKNRKKTVVMGLRIDKSGMGKTMVDMVYSELTKRLQAILERENIMVTVKLCHKPAEVPNGPLVVLCLNMSRVGTNILDALAGIKANHEVFVLVLHNTVKENLSMMTPTGLRVSGSELRQLGGIIDMAFCSDSGVYECDLNTTSVKKIATILKKYSK